MFFGRDLSNGEFGCILAHKSIYECIAEENIGVALILEDDAILCDELPSVVNALIRHQKNWDIVRFLGRNKNYRASRTIVQLPGSPPNHFARPHGMPGGAYGYVINNQAARRLLSMMEKKLASNRHPAWGFMAYAAQYRFCRSFSRPAG